MKGLLKNRSAGMQFLLLICIALVSLFFMGSLVGVIVMSGITGISSMNILDPAKLDFSKPGVITYMRGMQIFQFISLFLIPSFVCARLFSTDSKKYLGLKKPSANIYFIAGIVVMLLAISLTGFLGELNHNVRFPAGIEKWMQQQEA